MFKPPATCRYSYEINQPYYLQTGGLVSLTQHLFGPVDAVGRAGAYRLAYRDRAGAAVTASNRIDMIHTYGGGVGTSCGAASAWDSTSIAPTGPRRWTFFNTTV